MQTLGHLEPSALESRSGIPNVVKLEPRSIDVENDLEIFNNSQSSRLDKKRRPKFMAFSAKTTVLGIITQARSLERGIDDACEKQNLTKSCSVEVCVLVLKMSDVKGAPTKIYI